MVLDSGFFLVVYTLAKMGNADRFFGKSARERLKTIAVTCDFQGENPGQNWDFGNDLLPNKYQSLEGVLEGSLPII